MSLPRVLEEHFQRPEAEGLVEHLVDEALASMRFRSGFSVSHRRRRPGNFAAERVAGEVAGRATDQACPPACYDEAFEVLKALVPSRTSRFERGFRPG